MFHAHTTPRILVVDDAAANKRLMSESLADFGFVIDTADNGMEALEQARRKRPDLVLMDISMPVMDGITACRALKADPNLAEIPLIFITAHNSLENKLDGFAAGGVDYLTKPIHPEEVVARVTIHLGYIGIKQNLSQRLGAYEQRYGVLPEFSAQQAEDPDSAALVQSACHLLLQDPHNTPSLEGLIAQLNTNRDRLNKSFQIVFGMPPFAWLREERLRQAADMLRHGDKALKQIAGECGYSTPGNFNSAFKQRFGVTPGEFRRQYAGRRET